jgi:hypothetical protein
VSADADRFARDLMLSVAADMSEGAALLRAMAADVLAVAAMARPATAAEAAAVEAAVARARRVLDTRPTLN